MIAFLTLPLVGSCAVLVGSFIGLRGPLCGAVVAIAAATAWSLS